MINHNTVKLTQQELDLTSEKQSVMSYCMLVSITIYFPLSLDTLKNNPSSRVKGRVSDLFLCSTNAFISAVKRQNGERMNKL